MILEPGSALGAANEVSRHLSPTANPVAGRDDGYGISAEEESQVMGCEALVEFAV